MAYEKYELRTAGLLDSLEDLRASARAFGPQIRAVHRFANYLPRVFWTFVLGSTAATFVGEEIIKPGDFESASALQENEFEIIYYSPFSHVDLRIGEYVYSYSSGYVYRQPFGQHLDNRIVPGYQNATHLRLRVTKEEVEKLDSYMQDELGSIYLWGTPTYLCSAAAHRAITKNTSVKIPPGIDRSPALTEACLKIRKMFGDEKVSAIHFYSKDWTAVDKTLDAAVNFFDSLIFTGLMLESVLASTVGDQFPHSSNEVKSVIENIKDQKE